MMRRLPLVLLIAAAAPVGDEPDPNLKALPTAPIGRQSLPPPAPR